MGANQDSRRGYKKHPIRRMARSLIGPKKKNVTFAKEGEGRYYGHVYLNRQNHNAVAFLARINRLTMLQVANMAIEAGVSRLLGDAILMSRMRSRSETKGSSAEGSPNALALEVARWAKTHGFELGEHR
jgi:hypothetical protein